MIALDFRLFSNADYDELKSVATETHRRIRALNRKERLHTTLESNYRFYVCEEGPVLCDSIINQCDRAKYLRLSAKTILVNAGRLEGIDALKPNIDDENFNVLAKQVRSAIENGTPEIGLDRLHTFAKKYIRIMYERHFDKSPDRSATAKRLLGELVNDLREQGAVQSKMASEILKSSARVLEQFNHVRNNQSLAHDNPELISRDEAYFIYQSVAASIRFLESLE